MNRPRRSRRPSVAGGSRPRRPASASPVLLLVVLAALVRRTRRPPRSSGSSESSARPRTPRRTPSCRSSAEALPSAYLALMSRSDVSGRRPRRLLRRLSSVGLPSDESSLARPRSRARRRRRRRPGCGRRRRRWWSRRPASCRCLPGRRAGSDFAAGADSSGSAMSNREPPSGISVPGVEVAPPDAGAPRRCRVSSSALLVVLGLAFGVTSASASSWLRSTSRRWWSRRRGPRRCLPRCAGSDFAAVRSPRVRRCRRASRPRGSRCRGWRRAAGCGSFLGLRLVLGLGLCLRLGLGLTRGHVGVGVVLAAVDVGVGGGVAGGVLVGACLLCGLGLRGGCGLLGLGDVEQRAALGDLGARGGAGAA